ncbi:hypothetical protein Tco_0003625 [Tanacetum coccineum]
MILAIYFALEPKLKSQPFVLLSSLLSNKSLRDEQGGDYVGKLGLLVGEEGGWRGRDGGEEEVVRMKRFLSFTCFYCVLHWMLKDTDFLSSFVLRFFAAGGGVESEGATVTPRGNKLSSLVEKEEDNKILLFVEQREEKTLQGCDWLGEVKSKLACSVQLEAHSGVVGICMRFYRWHGHAERLLFLFIAPPPPFREWIYRGVRSPLKGLLASSVEINAISS